MPAADSRTTSICRRACSRKDRSSWWRSSRSSRAPPVAPWRRCRKRATYYASAHAPSALPAGARARARAHCAAMRTLPAALLALVACASEHAAAPQASGARVVAPSASAEASRDVAPAVAVAVARSARSREIAYPATRRADTADVLHGVRVPDPYQWLEEEKSPDVQAWMKEQDAFARKFLAPLPGRDAIARRLSELLYVDELGAPRHRGSRYFYSRRLATKEKAIVYVKDGRRGKERLLVDPTTFQNAELSIDGHWLVRTVFRGWERNNVSFRDARRPDARWTSLAVGNDALYDVAVFRDHFYVTTNEGAPHSRIFAVDPAHPSRDGWTEIVPERSDATLDSTVLVGGKLALVYLKDAVTHLEIHDLDGKLVREMSLPDVGTAG